MCPRQIVPLTPQQGGRVSSSLPTTSKQLHLCYSSTARTALPSYYPATTTPTPQACRPPRAKPSRRPSPTPRSSRPSPATTTSSSSTVRPLLSPHVSTGTHNLRTSFANNIATNQALFKVATGEDITKAPAPGMFDLKVCLSFSFVLPPCLRLLYPLGARCQANV